MQYFCNLHIAKQPISSHPKEKLARFLCCRTYFQQTIRIFAVLLIENRRKDVEPLSETRKAQNQDDYEKERK
jgi:hypothetical protein